MSGRLKLGITVFDAAVDRLRSSYAAGHRVVVSLSGGKDSGVCCELAIIAARETGRLPVEVVTRDEEILFPGTFEYCERLAARPEISMRWVVAHQPIVNAFDRAAPYWWVMDPQLDRDQWVRQPPPFAEEISDLDIRSLISPKYYPVAAGQELHAVMGLRVEESRARTLGLHSSGGYLTKPNHLGVRNLRPIYDWTDGDIWLAISKHGWDYNRAYDAMHRLGLARKDLRISPPTMSPAGARALTLASQAWPDWWNRVSRRLPSVRTYAQFGARAVQPDRRYSETWEQCFERTCIAEAPAWIAARAAEVRRRYLHMHANHSTAPLPDVGKCYQCGVLGSWRAMARGMYLGDPFSMKAGFLPYVEPSYFRPGSGEWNGPPTF